eukprot:6400207-Pyramimonas_sp.AAC.1
MSAAITVFADCSIADMFTRIMLMPELAPFLLVHPELHLGSGADDVQVLGVGSEAEVMRAGPNASRLRVAKLTCPARFPHSEPKLALLAPGAPPSGRIAAET